MAKRNSAWLLLLLLPFLGAAGGEPTTKPKGRRPGQPPGGDDPDEPDEPYKPKGPQVQPLEPDEPYKPKGPQVQPLEPDDPDPIRVNPDEPGPSNVRTIIKTYPTPAHFYQVVYGDHFLGDGGVATKYLLSALALAARNVGGLSVPEANAWASARNTAQRRLDALYLIECAPINDLRFGTYAYSDKSMAGPHGRAIRMLPINGDDASRLEAGQLWIRNVRLGQPGDPPSVSAAPVNGSYRHLELLWLPGVDLQRLWDSNGTVLQSGGEWSDGSSQINPPPLIDAVPVQDLSGSGMTVFGCVPDQREYG